MPKVIRREFRKRGVFGQILKWIFILFNVLMVFFMLKTCQAVGETMNQSDGSNAYAAGAAIGGTMVGGAIMIFWALGTVILGALTYFTRGPVTIVEETVD